MRCIQLCEPEHNMSNSQAGKECIENAEAANVVEPEQFGSRKRHKASTACLCKVLLTDIFRQKRHAGALAMNDAKGCYDRIHHVVAILVLMSFGLLWLPAKILFEALQLAEHRIKTAYGVSEHVYGNSIIPEMGTGQGNSIGPTTYTLISCIMIRIMKKRGHGVDMMSSLSLSLISIACFAYVDDTDLPVSGQHRTTTGEQLKVPFQNALTAWSKLLCATGGELAGKKSWCYIIDFKWDGNNWEYRDIEDMEGSYYLLDKNDEKQDLKRFEVSKGSETLGIFITMDGNNKDQRDNLRAKAEKFGEQINTSHCEPNEAIYMYNHCFIKSMEYCMPVMNFKEKDWDYIVAPAKKRTLQKAGMASNFPKDPLYGSQKYNGFKFDHPFTKQGIEKISVLLQESIDKTQAGNLMKATGEALRLELGFNMTMDLIPWEKVSLYLTKCWYRHLIEFVHESNKVPSNISQTPQLIKKIEIIEDFIQMPTLRKGDVFLMQAFIRANVPKKNLHIINIMRMSIKALTLADIATADGKHISSQAWNLISSNKLRDHYDWPRKPPNFSQYQIDLWKDAICKTFIEGQNNNHKIRYLF